ncbi:MAG: helix-turn-helix transcriptional regulator [bacterium]|nr:helix-turn-helix transcriptional regulator [bacterium]
MTKKSTVTVGNILAGARILFLRRNYAEVTMDHIAAAAEVTKGALYHHFNSKEELYLAMMHADLEEARRLHQQGIDFEGTCRQRLRVLTRAFLAAPREKQGVVRLVRRDVNIFGKEARDDLVRAYQAALPELVTQIVADGMAAGELLESDTRLLAWQFVALVEVTLSDYASSAMGDVDAKLDQVLDLFFSGVQAPVGLGVSA